jgi:hypothetical protein
MALEPLLLLITPFALGLLASSWLWRPFWGRQRDNAPKPRVRTIQGLVVLVACTSVALFVGRDHVPDPLGQQLMIGSVLSLVALLYSLVPPQHDL